MTLVMWQFALLALMLGVGWALVGTALMLWYDLLLDTDTTGKWAALSMVLGPLLLLCLPFVLRAKGR